MHDDERVTEEMDAIEVAELNERDQGEVMDDEPGQEERRAFQRLIDATDVMLRAWPVDPRTMTAFANLANARQALGEWWNADWTERAARVFAAIQDFQPDHQRGYQDKDVTIVRDARSGVWRGEVGDIVETSAHLGDLMIKMSRRLRSATPSRQ